MSKINHIIPQQAYELVRDRIGAVLADELNSQFLQSGNYDIDTEVWVERTMDFDKTELPAVNVSMAVGTYGNKNQGSVDGTYQYHIDVYASAKTKENSDGDYDAAYKLHQILGLCRAILEDPIYKTLGFVPGFIMRVMCSEINIAQTTRNDAISTMMGRLTFGVVANEKTALLIPNMIDDYITTVKLSSTNKGYLYIGENE